MSRRWLVTTAAMAMVSFATVAAAQDQAPAGDAKAGQQLFLSIGCWECHGTVGQGGAASGPRIAATALPYAAFLQQLRTPQSQMPPYEASVVPDASVANIYAYLKTLPAPQPVASIPILNNN
jgi:ubiquinol-cytochrome c reductase cytochrome c subunit